MSEQNKTNVSRLFEEVWNKGHVQIAEELIAPTYTHHDSSSPDLGRGPESEKKRVTLYRNAFPDIRFTVEDLLAEGETVVARWACRGPHKGELKGNCPTNKTINITGVIITPFTKGQKFESYVY